MRSLVDKSIGGDQKKEFQLELQQLVYTTRRERLKRSNQMKMLLSKRVLKTVSVQKWMLTESLFRIISSLTWERT